MQVHTKYPCIHNSCATYRALWYGMDENGPLSLPKLRDSCKVRLPLCHLSLLCSTTSRLAAKALHGESFSFHFLAVSDPPPVDLPSAEPFSELLLKMNVRLNGDIAAAQLADIPNSPIDQAATLPAVIIHSLSQSIFSCTNK